MIVSHVLKAFPSFLSFIKRVVFDLGSSSAQVSVSQGLDLKKKPEYAHVSLHIVCFCQHFISTLSQTGLTINMVFAKLNKKKQQLSGGHTEENHLLSH